MWLAHLLHAAPSPVTCVWEVLLWVTKQSVFVCGKSGVVHNLWVNSGNGLVSVHTTAVVT